MLTAFTPQPIIELKKQDKSKIEAVLAYGDRLLVGLSTGVLRIYRLNESTANDHIDRNAAGRSKSAELLREEEKFSKKPIQQLAIIKEANVLIALSDAYVSFYDLQTFALSERLEATKNANAFAVISGIVKDESTGIPSIQSKLAVAVKRKILVWSWHDMEMSDSVSELVLPATVKSLSWITGTRLIAGMDPGYLLVDIGSQSMTDIHRIVASGEASGPEASKFGAINTSGMGYMGMGSWVPKPLATKLSNDQMLLSKDVNTLFIDSDGQAIEKRQVPWLAAPEAIGYSYPYLLSLQPPSKGVLEIRNPDTTTLLQSITLPNATLLHVPQPNISLAHAGKGFLVASERIIWRMGAAGYSTQIDELVANKRYDEAISFVTLLEDTLLLDKRERLRDIKMYKARGLFEARNYRDALYLYSEASAPPSRVISLYPRSIAGNLTTFDEPVRTDSEENDEPRSPSTPQKKQKADDKGSLKGTPRAKLARRDSDAASVRSHKHSDSTGSADKMLEGKDLIRAVNELCAFLAQSRVQIRRFINYDGALKDSASEMLPESTQPVLSLFIDSSKESKKVDWQKELLEVATLVDTTLFRAYMLAKPGLAASLFRIENFCSPDVVEEKLYETGRYNDLIDFLFGKRLHKQALELLTKFGKAEDDEAVGEALRGPKRTVAYLQQLPFEQADLILHYAEWPLKSDPEVGMQIFLADTENAESLPRERVVDFLTKVERSLATQYLEHIINEWSDTEPRFHQQLIKLYLEELTSIPQSDADSAPAKARLESFLTTSTSYSPSQILRLLPSANPTFYISRATLLSRLGRHREALSIYVFDLSSPTDAELYCNKVYLEPPKQNPRLPSSTSYDPDSTDATSPQAIYTTLLSLYLNPPHPEPANLDAALSLLSRHGSRLPALSTLNLLPHSLPIKDLESYFRGRMRAANSLAREAVIVAALSGVQRTAAESALLLGEDFASTHDKASGRNRRVVIGENRTCEVCGTRFGRQAIRVWPDGQVVHYGCGQPGMATAGARKGLAMR